MQAMASSREMEAPDDVSATPTVGQVLQRDRVAILLAAAGWLAFSWPTLRGLFASCLEDPDFSHGLLIPLVSAAILFANRRELARQPARRSLRGLWLFMASIALTLLGALSHTNLVERVGIWGTLVGAVAFLFGRSLLRAKAFPFLFLLLCIPPPFILVAPLRLSLKGLATRMSADLLASLGYAAMPEGNVLAIGTERLEVADACSGIRSLMAVVSTAILFSYLFRAGFLKGALLTACAVPVTVVVNVLRIVIIGVALVSFEVDLTHGTEHETVGFAVFGLSLVLLYGSWLFIDWMFRWKPREASS